MGMNILVFDVKLEYENEWLTSLSLDFQEDKPWDWDRLFTEVTSELLTEWEQDEIGEQSGEGNEMSGL